MNNPNYYFGRVQSVARAPLFVVLVSLVFCLTFMLPARAADLTSRRVTLATSEASATTTHTFTFSNPTASVLGSIQLEYCDNSPLFNVACNAPAGLNLGGATLSSQTGNVGFIKDPLSTSSTVVLSRAPGASISTVNTYQLSSVVNPSASDSTFFVRISLFSTNDATGSSFDRGSVAFSTSGQFSVGGFVPPFLIFCVGVTVSGNCASTNGNLVNFGELRSTSTASVTTQFAAATNDPTGLQIFMNGQTMTSGNNIINPLSSRSGSSVGTPQFGLNLRANSSPSVGASRSGAGSIFPTTDYDAVNEFKFLSGDVIARSTLPTDFNVLTVSYLVNVPESQPAGVYATTLIYTALASF